VEIEGLYTPISSGENELQNYQGLSNSIYIVNFHVLHPPPFLLELKFKKEKKKNQKKKKKASAFNIPSRKVEL